MMQTATNTHSTQILTQKIKLENDIKPHISVKDRITKIFPKHKVHAVSVYYDNSTNSKRSVLEYPSCSNGFAAAIIHAYNYHQHLCLSPDDIWLAISQGVSHHINYNAEKFRRNFVKHEGQETVSIIGDDILSINPNENTLEAYFKYNIMFCCGIPKVTLEGTLEDWIKLQEKVIKLRNLNLELDFWLDRLEPVIWKLVYTYHGEIDEDFWSKVINMQSYGSGGQAKINGWIAAFFPYDRTGTALHSNYLDCDDIPDGTVEVPFTVDFVSKFKFVAGFIGANQEALENLGGESVVSPVIGWTVIDDVKNSSDVHEFF
ncbi:hypothetical protein F8M41_022176 [Gigaspora margarita]|uniref:Uncharacterized protein n=1 Tax=Gigaspora margarita TaxID=4874 RepID=A0A8H4AFI6_GIGMA|nr:hypothetical protein F8M41_022176 [Gigaspora margarita]